MAAPKKLPTSLKGKHGSDYVVFKDGEVIYHSWCSISAFGEGRRSKAGVYDGYSGDLIQDYSK